jgi:hypothetical protein
VLLSSSGVPPLRPNAALASTATSAQTQTKTVVREHLNSDGTNGTPVSRTVTVSVSATTELRDRQGLTISWSGAHPTGGAPPDPNTGNAAYLEYPMVILQCRGTTATVDPTTCWAPAAQERFQQDNSQAFPPWRLDRYASAAQRAQFVLPHPWPAKCTNGPADPHATGGSNIQSERWLPFAAPGGKVFDGTPDVINLCGGYPPEASGDASTLALPDNTTFAPTQSDGKGSTRFDVRDAQDNASLGCSDKVTCSLVVIPIMGISCDLGMAGADQSGLDACQQTGYYDGSQTGSGSLQSTSQPAVSGQLWWSSSNWRNRITFPLTFAPPASACDILGGKQPVYIQGSELMTQAATQWSTQFCLNPNYRPFTHVQTPEPQARNGLAAAEGANLLSLPGSVQAAFTSAAPGSSYSLPTVHAPVAATGFAVVFAIDDAQKHVMTDLKLTPRLLAKLLTESYPAENFIQGPTFDANHKDISYQALQKNPLNITQDPEFIGLNPGVPKITSGARSEAASTLMSLASSSDVISALTAYINADPEARAWLNGKPDPWGMVVNPNYRGISLPLDSWPLSDEYQPTSYYNTGDNNPCLRDTPVAYLPLVAAPKLSLSLIAQSMQYAIPNSTTSCTFSTGLGGDDLVATEKLVTANRQTPGNRFVIGLASLADAERYGLREAALQSAHSAQAPFDTYVSPTNASLRATFDLTSFDSTAHSWPIPYDKIQSDNSGNAYPGAMVVYADIPTSGLPSGNAAAYAQLLDFAAGAGQTPGLRAGQLPPGYLPMTSANGLGAMVTYTRAAAQDVRAQNGLVPPQTQPPPTSPTPGATASGAGSPPLTGGGPALSSGATPPGSARSSSTPSKAPSTSLSGSTTPATTQAAKTGGLHVSFASFALILLLVLALLGPVAIPAALVSARRKRR